MGWTGLHREKGFSHKEFFEAEFPSIEILATHTAGRTVYAAARKRTNPGEVFALVILTQWTRDHFNFTYKEMEEEMGPYEAECPAAILDLLSPTDNETANEWRATCRAHAAAQAAKPKVKSGDTIEFAEPIEFTNGDRIKTFVFEQRSAFRAAGRRYNLGRDWKKRSYAVVA